MKRKAKKKAVKETYKFGGRSETGNLEQTLANLLNTYTYHTDQVQLVPSPVDKDGFPISEEWVDYDGEKHTKRVIHANDMVSDLFFANAYSEKEVVLVPRSVLYDVFRKLVDSSITTKSGVKVKGGLYPPRFNSKYVQDKLKAREKKGE